MNNEGLGLPLFNIEEFDKTEDESYKIPEEKIVEPLVEVLSEVTLTPSPEPKEISQTLKKSLDDLFPEQRYDEKDVQKAKEILGPVALEFTSEELKDALAQVQYLAETWLDDLERKIFKGMTLREVLNEKGRL